MKPNNIIRMRPLILAVAAALLLIGCGTPEPTDPGETAYEDLLAGGDLTCDAYSIFSGQYVEDGKDAPVENVAALLVTNRSDRFLDLATLVYDIDGKNGTFVVTGLPPGRSAWVMESTAMTAGNSSVFRYKDCSVSFRDDIVASTDKITIRSDGANLTAVNNTQQTLSNVCVYYKVLHTDGNFFGGITYLVSFGTLEPGGSAESIAGHYEEGKTQIVRIGWQ